MNTFTLYIPRRYAMLYLSWELTPAGALRYAKKLPTDAAGRLGMHEMSTFWPEGKKKHTRKSLENFAVRIKTAIAYQEGKLGKPLSAGGGLINVSTAGA